ncbi:E3 ubiquitin ligase RBR family [Parasponia andersonii]|uniref:RanBP-type and C3HC4-type zinc finger-containing protein 1 n=1 Tax=Parasponia andersonii TaxID=3476 RepID=A0A2P5DA72_PARAD|nr:E3 ubiquitin ligase RBR family [Parasponia andersonii]
MESPETSLKPVDENDTVAGVFFDRFVREEETSDAGQQNYMILNEAEIRHRQEDDILRVSTALSEPRAAAIVLLRHFNWNISKLFDNWFDDEDRVRNEVGLFRSPIVAQFSPDCTITCGICFESYNNSMSRSSSIVWASCGHPFCRDCYGGYITKSVNDDGPGCLLLRCPDPSCAAAVGDDMIGTLTMDNSVKLKYARYLLRSYVEDSYRRRKIKWCPAPGCDYAVDFFDFVGNYRRGFDVYCRCSFNFCWNCNEEAHRPVDCDTVAKWNMKNKDESENANWILVNTKPCPQCKRVIEKSHGCNHMRCAPPCRYEFCWHCLGEWTSKTFHSCNKFLPEATTAADENEMKRREVVKASLVKYTHYYNRWAANLRSRQKAVEGLRLVQVEYLDKLSFIYGQERPLLRFLTEAWQQIIRCRRVLQWTYAYGYYFPQHQWTKKQFFEYLQGEAEFSLERLHYCAEKELEKYVNAEGTVQEFIDYRLKLAELTSVIGNYFKNLVRALEDGLTEVESNGSYWSCELCSFVNSLPTARCQMCYHTPVAVNL